MLLDCASCPGRVRSCGDCVVSVLLDPRPSMPSDTAAAIDVLQSAGLIGPVHLALVDEPRTTRQRTGGGSRMAG